MLPTNRIAHGRARDEAERIEKLVSARAKSKPGSAAYISLDRQIRASVKPGLYEHWKSSKKEPKRYRVSEVISTKDVKSGPQAFRVVCAALYPPHWGEKMGWELLGPNGFLTPINRPEEDYVGPRFVPFAAKKK